VEAAGDAAVRIQVRLLKADVQRLVKGSRADPPGLSTACSTWRRCAAFWARRRRFTPPPSGLSAARGWRSAAACSAHPGRSEEER